MDRPKPTRPTPPRFTGLEPLEPRQLFSGDTLSILPFGDSLTLGIGSIDQSYRKHLADRLNAEGVDFDFVGKLDDGNGYDNDHYSVHGARARDSYTNSSGVYRKSLVEALRDDSVLERDEQPDVILLHVGTNSVHGVSADRGIDELRTLLDEMARYWRDGRFASDVQVLLAEIVPAGRGDNKTVGPEGVVETAEYNRRIQGVVNGMSDQGFASRISLVDFFAIDAGAIGLSGGDRAKADTDGDRYVDWFNNVNEADPRATATANNDLMRANDYLHPSALGYKVMGYNWFTAMDNAGLLDGSSTPAPPPPDPQPQPDPDPPPPPPTPQDSAGVFDDLPGGYSLAAQGDFDGDGDTDYLFRNLATAGTLVRTAENGKLVAEAAVTDVDDWWAVRDVADFNNDGRDDIFWVSRSRRVGTWLMDGVNADLSIPTQTATQGTRFTETRDVNGDGQRDVVWTARSGDIVWFLNQGRLVSIDDQRNTGRAPAPAPTPPPPPAPTPTPNEAPAPPAGFAVAASGDFDGDGDNDQLLWNRNSTETRVRLIQGGSVATDITGFRVTDRSWRVDRVGDFNNDGRDDIAWINNSGRIAQWFVNGARIDLVFPNG